MKVSVVLNSNRTKELKKAIDLIKRVNGVSELIVVDASEKKLPTIYQKKCSKYIFKKCNLSQGRNIGIRSSKGEIIAFTDDDCIPKETWLTELLKGFLDEKVMAVCGKTIAAKKYQGSLYEKAFSFSKIGNDKKVISGFSINIKKLFRIGHGNNMAFRKKVFEKIGYFDEELGVGSKGLAGEDLDMFWRILKNNYKITYIPTAIVEHKHLIPEDKLPEFAWRNGYANRQVINKNIFSIKGLAIFVMLSLWYIINYVRKRDKIRINYLKGWFLIKRFSSPF